MKNNIQNTMSGSSAIRKIALVGNPNCGKSTMFNFLTGGNEYVGNRPGVTVEAKEGFLKADKSVVVADTPGVYSLSPFSPDEIATENYLRLEKPDVIINLADSRSLKRNLYLTTQVLELGIPTVLVINNFEKELSVDTELLGELLGIEIAVIRAKSGENLQQAAEKAISLMNSSKKSTPLKIKRSTSFDGDAQSADINDRYAFVDEILSFCKKENKTGPMTTQKIDKIVLNKFLAFPIFFALIFLVYYLSVSVIGSAASAVLEKFFNEGFSPLVMGALEKMNCAEWLCSLFENALLTATFTVLSFLPQIFMLFFSLTMLEESGYMARAAFITDAVFKNSGLSGKSLISFLVGSTCTVTGIMASRTIENKKSRDLTTVLTPFIPCSAKMTVIALVSANNFASSKLTLLFVFLFSFSAIIFSAKLLKRHKSFASDPSFLLEMPPYTLPSAFEAAKKAFRQSAGFVKKAVMVIFLSSVMLWALSYFGFDGGRFTASKSFAESFLGFFGEKAAAFFAPLGFGNAQCTCAMIAGLFAKENIIGTLSMFSSSLPEMTVADALSFLLFNLFCPPCIVAVGTMKKELGSLRLTAFALLYQTVFAYALAFAVRMIIRLALKL